MLLSRLLLIGIGGFLGAVLRFLIGDTVQRLAGDSAFPYGTLVANMVGCFLIGLLTGLAINRGMLSPQLRLFLITGLLGSLTTYSTFLFETSNFLRNRELLLGLADIGVHLLLGLAMVWIGDAVTRLNVLPA